MPNLKEGNKLAGQLITDTFREKLSNTKEDMRFAGLVAIELIVIIILVVGIAVYLDPEIDIIPAPYNYIGFIITAAFAAAIYHYTANFRKSVKPRF
jgi:hypothetical protein